MTRWLVALGLAVVAAVVPAEGAALEGTLKKIKETGTIVIGYRDTARPFSFLDENGKPAGYSVDLCRRVAVAVERALGLSGLQTRFEPLTAETRFEAVVKGKVDIECGATTNTLSRQERVDFTNMTFVDGGSLLVVDGLGIRGVSDLGGKRVAVIPDTTTAPALSAALERGFTKATVIHVKNHDEGLALLERGAADAYASDRTLLIGVGRRAKQPERYALVDELFSYEPHGFMVRRDDAAFRLVVNRTLSQIYRSGEIVDIYRKWFGDIGPPSPALKVMYILYSLPE